MRHFWEQITGSDLDDTSSRASSQNPIDDDGASMITHHPRSPSYYDDDEPRAQTPTIYVQPSAAPWEVSDSSEAESTPATPAPRRTPSPLPEPTPKRPRHSSPPPAETPAFEFPFVDAVFAPIRDDASPPDGGDDDNSDYTPSEAEEAEDIADDGLILLEDILEGAVVDASTAWTSVWRRMASWKARMAGGLKMWALRRK
jgi:hypothetical protein